VENTLGLTRLSEEANGELIKDKSQANEKNQIGADHSNILNGTLSHDLLLNVWEKASNQLKPLCSAEFT